MSTISFKFYPTITIGKGYAGWKDKKFKKDLFSKIVVLSGIMLFINPPFHSIMMLGKSIFKEKKAVVPHVSYLFRHSVRSTLFIIHLAEL